MNRDERRLVRRAANMLLAEARLGRESCMVNAQPWACGDCAPSGTKCNARRTHDAQVKVATKLKALANR
jgi:hypothetical protein